MELIDFIPQHCRSRGIEQVPKYGVYFYLAASQTTCQGKYDTDSKRVDLCRQFVVGAMQASLYSGDSAVMCVLRVLDTGVTLQARCLSAVCSRPSSTLLVKLETG